MLVFQCFSGLVLLWKSKRNALLLGSNNLNLRCRISNMNTKRMEAWGIISKIDSNKMQ